MEEGRLAKYLSPEFAQKPQEKSAISPPISSSNWEKIPTYIWEYFNYDISNISPKIVQEVSDILSYVKEQVPVEYQTPGNISLKFAELERKFGATNFLDRRHSKMYRFIKLSNRIKDLEKQRESIR